MVISSIILILVLDQARAASIIHPRYRGDQSAVNFGAYEAAAAEAVVVEVVHHHRHPRQFGLHFGSAVPVVGHSANVDNSDCKGYSMLGCV